MKDDRTTGHASERSHPGQTGTQASHRDGATSSALKLPPTIVADAARVGRLPFEGRSMLRNIYGNDQLGDCHDDKTEVLTESGWVLWPNYDGESLLGTMNKQSQMLEFQAPIAVTRREHRGRMAFADHKRLDLLLRRTIDAVPAVRDSKTLRTGWVRIRRPKVHHGRQVADPKPSTRSSVRLSWSNA